ncbi:hypothetical protein Tco_0999019, partial [Tanacetum coccineum]
RGTGAEVERGAGREGWARGRLVCGGDAGESEGGMTDGGWGRELEERGRERAESGVLVGGRMWEWGRRVGERRACGKGSGLSGVVGGRVEGGGAYGAVGGWDLLSLGDVLVGVFEDDFESDFLFFLDLGALHERPEGALPSNTKPNPRGDLKAITTRSDIFYDRPLILPTSSLLKEVEREPKVTKDTVQPTSSESTAHVQPPVV